MKYKSCAANAELHKNGDADNTAAANCNNLLQFSILRERVKVFRTFAKEKKTSFLVYCKPARVPANAFPLQKSKVSKVFLRFCGVRIESGIWKLKTPDL